MTAEQRTATVAYWASLAQLDENWNKAIKRSIDKFQQDEPSAESLTRLATETAEMAEKYNAQVGALSVLNVDQRLVEDTTRDIRSGVAIVQHLNGLAEALTDYVSWARQKQNPSAVEFLGDLFDSFIMGMQGRPFAGYNAMKAKAASLDAEGRGYIEAGMLHAQALERLRAETAEGNAREIELRAFLSMKYGVEFPPRLDGSN